MQPGHQAPASGGGKTHDDEERPSGKRVVSAMGAALSGALEPVARGLAPSVIGIHGWLGLQATNQLERFPTEIRVAVHQVVGAAAAGVCALAFHQTDPATNLVKSAAAEVRVVSGRWSNLRRR